MVAELGARDRLIMAGLVVLGVLTVIAGVFSGRTTLHYILLREAVAAATSWTDQIEQRLYKGQGSTAKLLGRDVTVVAPEGLRRQFESEAENIGTGMLKPGQREFGWLAGLDRVIADWALRRNRVPQDYASRLEGFVLFDADKSALLISGAWAPSLASSLAQSEALDAAIRSDAVEVQRDGVAESNHPVVLVPVAENGTVKRVYAFLIDQTAAASLTNVALTVVTLTTSLLIVMGFSVPAAIASRRIRERWRAEDQIRFLALHDALTGLPNRVQLHHHLKRAAGRARRHGDRIAVFCLDLDRFKDVNDTLGHATGDALLEEVAVRLKQSVREIDLVGRLGGDEFAIVAEDMDSPEDAVRMARRLCGALHAPYHVNGHDLTTSASIGIAFGPLNGDDDDVLLTHADLALYRAKQDGRNTFRFFEPAMDAALQRRRWLEMELREALRRNQLYLDYQAQFDLNTGRLTGYEALVRWWHPLEGEIPPSTFLPIAEETGLIKQLGEWILRTACAYATTWPADQTLAVNLSQAQFKTQDVVELVSRVLAETGLAPQRLELEITEGILLQNTDAVVETLRKLDALGVSVAMDDFGTGYSSLSYLTRFPVKKIKIDRSFVDTLGSDPQTGAIVSSIVGLGQSLHVTITAEGVETENQAALLKRWGCHQVQGHYYGKPAPLTAEDQEAEARNRPLVA